MPRLLGGRWQREGGHGTGGWGHLPQGLGEERAARGSFGGGTVWPAGGLLDSLPCPQKVRDTGERREPSPAQKQPQQSEEAAGAQSSGNPWQGFMKCLLEVEEEEATHRRASKARALTTRKSPKTLSPVGSCAPSLPLTLPQTPTSSPATAPPWARPMAPGATPAPMAALVPATVPCPVLPVPTMDVGWRRQELLPQTSDRSLSYTRAR